MQDLFPILIGAHLFGVVLGMGAAFMSDFMFFASIRDERVTATELRFLRLGGKVVWLGLGVVALSGVLLVLTDPAEYLVSNKFIAKMAVVGVLAVNGAAFHLFHIPRLHRHAGEHFPSSDEFVRHLPFLVASGAVSLVSWTSAFVLGLLRGLPFPAWQIIAVYAALIVITSVVAITLRKKLVPHLRD